MAENSFTLDDLRSELKSFADNTIRVELQVLQRNIVSEIRSIDFLKAQTISSTLWPVTCT